MAEGQQLPIAKFSPENICPNTFPHMSTSTYPYTGHVSTFIYVYTKAYRSRFHMHTQVYIQRHKCTYSRCTFKYVFLVTHIHMKAHTVCQTIHKYTHTYTHTCEHTHVNIQAYRLHVNSTCAHTAGICFYTCIVTYMYAHVHTYTHE